MCVAHCSRCARTDASRTLLLLLLPPRPPPPPTACRLAVFRCECCGAEATEVVHNGIIAVPPQCPSATCGRKQTLRIIPNRCAYANRQVRNGTGGVGSHKPHTTPPSVTEGQARHGSLNRMHQLPATTAPHKAPHKAQLPWLRCCG